MDELVAIIFAVLMAESARQRAETETEDEVRTRERAERI
jgi:hypothetical protein